MYRILLFAGLAETTGVRAVELDLQPEQADRMTIRSLKSAVAAMYPETASLVAASFAAINHVYVSDEATASPNDEIALIPPVSGG